MDVPAVKPAGVIVLDVTCTFNPTQGDPYPITGTWQMQR